MPFIGQDWRSPGEVWIKTEEGWERMKLLRKSHFIRQGSAQIQSKKAKKLSNVGSSKSLSSSPTSSLGSTGSAMSSSSSSGQSDSDSDIESGSPLPPEVSERDAALAGCEPEEEVDEVAQSVVDIIERLKKSSSQPIPRAILRESSSLLDEPHLQPYCRVTLSSTKEVAGCNIISDAFLKLDFCNAIRDIRRFSYVTKLLHLLITQNLTTLSGNATKALFWMLEEIAKQVATNKQNINVIRQLLVELRQIVEKNLCWGRPLGSTSLWDQHLRTMERICEMTERIEIKPPTDCTKPQWAELPEELIREILLRLSDYKDLERAAQACERMHSLLNEEQHIWKQLCKYHFAKHQREWALKRAPPGAKVYDGQAKLNWANAFHVLRKKFGLKEEYADCIFLCRYCRCLFWNSKGHPCILENPDLTRQPLNSPTGSSHIQHESLLKPSRKTSLFSSSFPPNPSSSSGSASLPPRVRQASAPSAPSSSARVVNPLQHRFAPSIQGPVVVQNFPFFDHPLVLQRRRAADAQGRGVAQADEDGSGLEARPPSTNAVTTSSSIYKAPLHVPITPEEFLKFFSL